MKNIKKISILAILVLTVFATNSCKKFLDKQPITAFGPDVAFANEENALKTLLATYSRLAGEQGYGKVLSLYMMVDDDAMTGPPGTQNDRRAIAHYTLDPGNTEINAPFRQLYAGIERANLCIKYIPQMTGYATNPNLKRMYAEALTLRAQFYFALIVNWGDVPVQFAPAVDIPDLYLPKADRDSTYDHLLDDLKIAEDLVDWRSAYPIDERITKGAVKGLRARIALHRGGWSLRRDRTMKRGSNFIEYYKIARDECRDIINSGEHHLNPSYQAVFKDNLLSHKIEPNGEIMFEVAMSGQTGGTSSRMGNYDGPKVFGVPSSQQDAIKVLPQYFYLFDSLDTRRDVTCAPYTNNADANRYMKPSKISAISFGKYRSEWISPSVQLYTTNQYDVNWPLLRYSDVLLMYAEAINEIEGAPNADAINAYEEVRKRAFGANASMIGTTPTTKGAFFQAIVDERSREFGGEAIRKYDLIRWNKFAESIADARAKMDLIISGINPYSPNPAPLDSIPKSVFYQLNSPTLVFGNSLYYPTKGSTPPQFGKSDWQNGFINTNPLYLNYASGFQANKNELYPIHSSIINDNYRISQDYGF